MPSKHISEIPEWINLWDSFDTSLFYSQYDMGADSECWIWRGTLSNNTPRFTAQGFSQQVIHVLYYIVFEDIPHKAGKETVFKTTCKKKLCVNPHHRVIEFRKAKSGRRKKTYCVNGHDRRAPNALYESGQCKACIKERAKKAKSSKPYKKRPWYESAEELLEKF